MNPRTCVMPEGFFQYGIHKPHFRVMNLRKNDFISPLGRFADETVHDNRQNFPPDAVEEKQADWIYEIPNAFPFRGTSYITKSWADKSAADPSSIALPPRPETSFAMTLRQWFDSETLSSEKINTIYRTLPDPVLLTLASSSTDEDDLVRLAELCCDFVHKPGGNRPMGLRYQKDNQGRVRAVIHNRPLFEVLANNLYLPDEYKRLMVLKPGAQGGSEIIGEWKDETAQSHVFEYLRRNSYIPWGHYAANMADDAVRYRMHDLSASDITGLRHLYYQRTYVRMARQLGLSPPPSRQPLAVDTLEKLRTRIIKALESHDWDQPSGQFNATLWGWNFGFDFASSHYRLHASHQQVHQQYALLPRAVAAVRNGDSTGEQFPAYGCGDPVNDFVAQYRHHTGRDFFAAYIRAIRNNRRLDGRTDRDSSLIIHEDERVMVFVPKAQTSQWEIQLVTLQPVGNILETDTETRRSLDRALLVSQKALAAMGAGMVTTIEYSKRFNSPDTDQRLLYALLPKLPESPGAFSEAQLRSIIGHYPEDFAIACRRKISDIIREID